MALIQAFHVFIPQSCLKVVYRVSNPFCASRLLGETFDTIILPGLINLSVYNVIHVVKGSISHYVTSKNLSKFFFLFLKIYLQLFLEIMFKRVNINNIENLKKDQDVST